MSHAQDKFYAREFLASMNGTERAITRSCAGPHSASWLLAVPHEDALSLDDVQFRCAISRRLCLPVNPVPNTCSGCTRELDSFGFHRTTCMRTGLVHARHKSIVSYWRRIFKECGVNIPNRDCERFNRDTHLRRSETDARRMDLVTPGLSGVFNGKPLFIDATCISPVHGNGTPMSGAADNDGICLQRKDRDTHEIDYPDVSQAPHAQLLSLSVVTYGRWERIPPSGS